MTRQTLWILVPMPGAKLCSERVWERREKGTKHTFSQTTSYRLRVRSGVLVYTRVCLKTSRSGLKHHADGTPDCRQHCQHQGHDHRPSRSRPANVGL